MTLTVRSSSVTGATTASRALTHAEMDANWAHFVSRDAEIQASLAASTGAALVGFTQSGSGAVSRTTQAKLRDIVSVEDFGAVGDDSTDDYTAINSCLTAHGGSAIIWFPPGIYRIGTGLSLDNRGTILRGSNRFGGSGKECQLKTTAAINALTISNHHCVIEDLELVGGSTGTHGIVCHNGAFSNLNRLNISGFTGDGVRWDTAAASPTGNNNLMRLSLVRSASNGGKGFHVPTKQSDNNGLEFYSCYSTANTSHGLLYKGEGMRVFGGIYEGNGGYGIQISESGDAATSVGSVMFYPWLESNTSGGVRGGGESDGNILFRGTNQQGLTNAAGSEDIEIVISNNGGGIWSVGNDQATLEIYGNSAGSYTEIRAAGGAANVPLRINAEGSGVIHLGNASTGGITVGGTGNAVVKKILEGVANPSLGTINAQTVSTFTITVTGAAAATGDYVTLGTTANPGTGLVWCGAVSAADTVTVRVANPTAGNIATTDVTWLALVHKR
jgi:hypothetical protein